MAYRDDRQALSLQVARLEREKAGLQKRLAAATTANDKLREQQIEKRRALADSGCALCGGRLLPVAVFAGRDLSAPLPLQMSTARFCQPGGGFTHSASVLSKACSSCGFIHNFIDMEDGASMADPESNPGEPTPDP